MQQLIGVSIFLLSCIGHTELWVMIVNRSFAFPIKATHLRKFRTLHDIAIVVFPWLLLWNCGLGSRGLLTGGSSPIRHWFWQTILDCHTVWERFPFSLESSAGSGYVALNSTK